MEDRQFWSRRTAAIVLGTAIGMSLFYVANPYLGISNTVLRILLAAVLMYISIVSLDYVL